MANFDFDTTVGAVTSTSTLSNLISKADFESLLRNLKPTDSFKVPSGSGISVPDTYYDFTSSGPGSGTWEVYYDVAGSSGYEGWSSPANAFADTGEITASQTSSAVAVGAVFTNLFAGDSTNGWNVTTGTEHFILKSGSVELVVKVDTANSKITNVYSNTGGTATDVTGDAPVPIMNTNGSDPDPNDDSVSGGITINPDGGSDFDFRVNGDTDNPLFFCDVSEDLTSIGGFPEAGNKLKVTGNTKITGNLEIGGNITLGGSGFNLDNLSNVSGTPNATPASMEVLYYNTSSNQWVPATISEVDTVTSGEWAATEIGTAYGGTGLSTIGTSGQILSVSTSGTCSVGNHANEADCVNAGGTWTPSGLNWVDNTPTLISLTDTTLSGLANGDILKYDGTAWVNGPLDLNGLTAATVNPAVDSIAIIDSDNSNATRKETVAGLMTAIAGTGLDVNASTKKLELDIPELQSLNHLQIDTADEFAVYDASETTGATHKSLTLGSLASKLAGTGLTSTNGVMALDIASLTSSLTESNINDADSFVINDASASNTPKKISWLDLFDSIQRDICSADTTFDNTNLAVGSDNFLYIDTDNPHTLKRAGISTFINNIAGTDLSASNGVLSVDNLDAAKINTGTFDSDRIPNLNASKITAGTFGSSRIPNLDASKITAGTLSTSRIPTLDAEDKIDFSDTGLIEVLGAQNNNSTKFVLGGNDTKSSVLDFTTKHSQHATNPGPPTVRIKSVADPDAYGSADLRFESINADGSSAGDLGRWNAPRQDSSDPTKWSPSQLVLGGSYPATGAYLQNEGAPATLVITDNNTNLKKASSTLSAAVTAGATVSLPLADASDFDSAGFGILAGGACIKWTSKSGNTLNGVSGVAQSYSSGTAVHQIQDDTKSIQGACVYIENNSPVASTGGTDAALLSMACNGQTTFQYHDKNPTNPQVWHIKVDGNPEDGSPGGYMLTCLHSVSVGSPGGFIGRDMMRMSVLEDIDSAATNRSITLPSGSTTATVSGGTAAIDVGDYVWGSGFPGGIVVLSKTSTSVTFGGSTGNLTAGTHTVSFGRLHSRIMMGPIPDALTMKDGSNLPAGTVYTQTASQLGGTSGNNTKVLCVA